MRKTKLLLAACALLLGVSNAMAQKDVTSQYITNATLSNGTTGWTVSNFNDPKQGNNTVGYASEAYSGWGSFDPNTTPFYLKQTITLPAGHYTLVNYSFFRQGEAYNTNSEKSLAVLKAGANEIPLKTLGSITANGYANSQAEGANAFDSKMYRNALDFTIDANDTEIEIGLEGTFDEMRSWCIAGMFELINNDIPATMDAPFDVTGYITNPGFEYRDMTGWTVTGGLHTQNNSQGFKVGGYYAENWQQSGALPECSMSQTLTGLSAGFYKLTVNLGGDGTYVDLNGKTANWTADKDYTVGYVLAENEDLVITAGKTAEGAANWIHFDNFRLQFCGDVQAALTTLLAKLPSYEGKIPSAAYNALVPAVSAYDKSYSDVDELVAAITAVQNLYNDVDVLVGPYANWLTTKANAIAVANGMESVIAAINIFAASVEGYTDAESINADNTNVINLMNRYSVWCKIKDLADALVAVNNDNADANTTLANTITADFNELKEIKVTDRDEAISFIGAPLTYASAVYTAMIKYVGAANPVGDGAKFDLTFMLTNPDLSVFKTNGPQAGWYTDQTFDAQNSQVMQSNNSVANSTDNTKFAMYEYWSDKYCATSGYTVYTTVTLPEGTYRMDALCMTGWGWNASSPDGARNITFSAGDVDGTSIVTSTLEPATLDFVQASKGEVKIGLKAHDGNTCNWMGIGYVQLFKVPAVAVTINEAADYTPESVAGKVTLKRTLSTANWNSFVVPFQITNEELKEAFGDGVEVAEFSEVADGNNSTVSFTKMTTPAIAPNKPVLLKPATVAGDNTYVFKDRTVATGDAKVAGTGNFDFVGTYAASTTIASGDWFISGDKVWKSAGATTIQGTRAYLKAKSATARIANFVIGDEATGISEMKVAANDKAIFNLQGQRVKNAQKGLFIQNGKKVIIK